MKSYLLDEVYGLKSQLKVLQYNYLIENLDSNEKGRYLVVKTKLSIVVHNCHIMAYYITRPDMLLKEAKVKRPISHFKEIVFI